MHALDHTHGVRMVYALLRVWLPLIVVCTCHALDGARLNEVLNNGVCVAPALV